MKQFNTQAELQREIDRVAIQIDKSTSIYQRRDLTRYLRRLQKERFRRTKEQK